MRRVIAALLVCGLMTSAPPAAACSVAPLTEHRIDPSEQALDVKPPSAKARRSNRKHGDAS